MDSEKLVSLVLENLKSESDARELQSKLMVELAKNGYTEYANSVAEISSDESNHALKYEEMYQNITGIKPAVDK